VIVRHVKWLNFVNHVTGVTLTEHPSTCVVVTCTYLDLCYTHTYFNVQRKINCLYYYITTHIV